MTIEQKFTRRPKPPKLQPIDLTNVMNPYDKDSSTEDTERTQESEDNCLLSTDRTDTVVSQPSNYLASFVNKAIQSQLYSQNYNSNQLLNTTPRTQQTLETIQTTSTKLTNIEEDDDNCDSTIPPTPITNINKINQKLSKKSKSVLTASYNNERDFVKKLYSSTNLTTKSLVRPFKHLGPDPLPIRALQRHNLDVQIRKSYYDDLTYENYDEIRPLNETFVLNDFLRNNNVNQNIIDTRYNILSTHSYAQICRILADKIEQEKAEFYDSHNVHIQTLMPDIEPHQSRKPIRQTMIEMASYLKNELTLKTGAVLKTKFNPVSKWQRMNGAQTELVIFEDKSALKEKEEEEEEASNDQITPAQLAIVDCLLRNGLALSLKGHFIDKLPDLASLTKTLIYINLSFNNFSEFPFELFNVKQLEAIKLRSNPIKSIPDQLSNLRNLKILQFSYCQLKILPECIFELEFLVQLDVAYNTLTFIDEKIVNLKYLKTLNYEGNEIEYLPSCMLKMVGHLEHINVKNNYLHPLFWKKIFTNKVQSLFDMSAAKCTRIFSEDSVAFDKLSYEVKEIVTSNIQICECCREAKVFGDGLRIIKPCEKIFGVKFLPFLFYSCSSECYFLFKKNYKYK